jgi:RNA polymerase primary sigma factor
MPKFCDSRAHCVSTPFDAYLRDINDTPLLDAAEEQALAYRIGEGDAAARDHLVRANLRLVVNIARSYAHKGLEVADLIAEGNLGLLRAAEAFDPSMGTRFSTYACYWIKQSMKRAIVNTGKAIRVPAYMNELLVKWRRMTRVLQEELDRSPTQEEIAARLGLGPKKLRVIEKALRVHNGMPQTGNADEELSLEQMCHDSRGDAAAEHLVHSEDVTEVLALLDKMDPREAKVLRLRFGLEDNNPCTLKEIGDRLSLTRERVRQLEQIALNKLAEGLQIS